MQQAEPEFIRSYRHKEIADGLGIALDSLCKQKPIEEISTGLPYIIIPIDSLDHINQIKLDSQKAIDFLIRNNRYKTNSPTKLTTSLFFVTEDTFEEPNHYNTRMYSIENEKVLEDAATGSANGCFLAYLLKNESTKVLATTEQGFQMNRKSYINLEGVYENNQYTLRVGGQIVDVSRGKWTVKPNAVHTKTNY